MRAETSSVFEWECGALTVFYVVAAGDMAYRNPMLALGRWLPVHTCGSSARAHRAADRAHCATRPVAPCRGQAFLKKVEGTETENVYGP